MDNELVEAVARSFAWTPGAGSYKHFPQYVNLTGNRLTVRGPEFVAEDGHYRMGPTVSIDLPDEVIADLSAALAATPLASLKAALEPCPLCGGEAGVGSDDAYDDVTWQVFCKRCYATIERDLKDRAVKLWNTRTPLAALKAENEALRGALTVAADDLRAIQTLNSHGANDQTYIGWLRNNASEAERKARAALTKQGG